MMSKVRVFGVPAIFAGMTLGALAGCEQGNNSNVTAPPPTAAATAPPPAPPKDELNKDGTPSHSSAKFDSATGGTPPGSK